MTKVPSDLTLDNLFEESIREYEESERAQHALSVKRFREALNHVFKTDFGVDNDFLMIEYKGADFRVRRYDNGIDHGFPRLMLTVFDISRGTEGHPSFAGTPIPNVFSDMVSLGRILSDMFGE